MIYFWYEEGDGWFYGDPEGVKFGPWHSFETLLYRWETKQPDLRVVA